MTFPTYDVSTGLQLTPDGRDIKLLWPSDGGPWVAAVVRALLWQIKGQWVFDLDRGVDYDRVLGLPADPREVQEIFREQISKYVDLTDLTVSIDRDEILVTWRGSGAGEEGQISLLEPPAIDAPELLSALLRDSSTIVLQFDRQLNPARLPDPEDFEFELIPPGATVTAAEISGSHLVLTLSQPIFADFDLLYRPSAYPMQSIERINILGFRVSLDAAGQMITEGGETLTTEDGQDLLL